MGKEIHLWFKDDVLGSHNADKKIKELKKKGYNPTMKRVDGKYKELKVD